MTYRELAKCMYAYTEGIAPNQLDPICRTAVREVCRDTNLIAHTESYEWKDDGIYRLDHVGYAYNQIVGMWVDEHQELSSRLDPDFHKNVRVFDDHAILRFPEPKFYGDLFPNRLDRKLTIKFSLMPRTDSEDFPALLYDQNERLVQVAVLKNLGPFIKEGNRRTSYGGTYKREYDELLQAVKLRNSQYGFGSRQTPSTLNDSFTVRGIDRRWLQEY